MSDAVSSDLARYEADIDRAERRRIFIEQRTDELFEQWLDSATDLADHVIDWNITDAELRMFLGKAVHEAIRNMPYDCRVKLHIFLRKCARTQVEREADSPREYDGPDPSEDA